MKPEIAELSPTRSDPRAVYEIQVKGRLDQSWGEWFSNLTVTLEPTGGQPPTTTLTGAVADQAALRGILCRLWDLNLTIVSVRRIEREETGG